MPETSFSKKERLKKDLIKAVLDKGICYRGKAINTYILRRAVGKGLKSFPPNGAAFVCKKRLYNKKSVLRNRIKRVLREAYRKAKHYLPFGHDVVIVATNVTKDTKSTLVEKEVIDVFQKYSKK